MKLSTSQSLDAGPSYVTVPQNSSSHQGKFRSKSTKKSQYAQGVFGLPDRTDFGKAHLSRGHYVYTLPLACGGLQRAHLSVYQGLDYRAAVGTEGTAAELRAL